MDKEKTGTLIKEARIRKGYSQQELGDIIGVTNKAVSRWERGESFPDVALLDVAGAVGGRYEWHMECDCVFRHIQSESVYLVICGISRAALWEIIA